jgi:hypothetical protein
MSDTQSIKITNAALDDWEGDIVLRGVIDPASLELLKVAEYQREILPITKIRSLMVALESGGVPDVDLGMRGGAFLEREGAFYLRDEVFIIDGLQRRTAALQLMKKAILPRLGATIHFNTNEEWERERFRRLNVSRVALSPNVLLRNDRPDNAAVDMLYNLCRDSTFVLCGRVCWDQRMRRDHLVRAVGLLKSAAVVHSRMHPGLKDTNWHGNALALDALMSKIGRSTMRDNVRALWEAMDSIWNVRGVVFIEGAPYLRQAFVRTFARLINDHQDFWNDARLEVPKDFIRKMSIFPMNDPYVAQLASGSGSSWKILYRMLVDHINSGKKIHRLRPFEQTELENEEVEVG